MNDPKTTTSALDQTLVKPARLLRVRTGLKAGALNAYLNLKGQKTGDIKG